MAEVVLDMFWAVSLIVIVLIADISASGSLNGRFKDLRFILNVYRKMYSHKQYNSRWVFLFDATIICAQLLTVLETLWVCVSLLARRSLSFCCCEHRTFREKINFY